MLRALIVLAFVTVAPFLSSAAQAQSETTTRLIERGVALHDDLSFEEALQVLSAALVRADSSEAEAARIYRYLSYTYLALGREAEAAGAYRLLLAIAVDEQPDASLSPRFREFLTTVRTEWEAAGRPGLPPPTQVSLGHTSPPQSDPGDAIELRAQINQGAARVARVVLAYRQGSEAVYRRADTRVEAGEFVAEIPSEAVAPPLVEYYFEALDAAGLPVASRGDVQAPMRVAVPDPDAGGSIFRTWWFWTAVGVVVTGAVVGGVLASQGGDDLPEQSGTLRITVR